jgi:putative drug exporter of the RND superfamily
VHGSRGSGRVRGALVAQGFSISCGIFVAAFVMAMFFTPVITALIKHAAWWPGHGDETRKPQKQTRSV